ncbi:GntR family transcriptional regulator [Sphaerisporangium krabiense]|uniref:DNA-binding GntR family transcriptional regulator n=1 Tax=Sphaerisporangium krabiense TaxID=763782 RepID=A0A7W9DU66_9ACTN|nr:GntR family transcriptional regulator [Sphaerisporangium krabiense]MBB5631386.1 DNA-binding GntR family transcriptional regulator [Sphaerisporangium krabiense]GII60804.1 GntR family transcriptional regulator [Sphaerisporangium krabiense]
MSELFGRLVAGHPRDGRTAGQLAYELLRQGIITGALAPGLRLRQEELAERIGVSRIPVRTALMQLESEGLVSFHPHRGAVVRTLTVEQVREIYALRALVETHALRASIATMTSARAARLRELGEALDGPHEPGGLRDERVAFYRELYDAEGNPFTMGVIEDLRDIVNRYLAGRHVAHGLQYHRELARLAARGDTEHAEGVLRDYLSQYCRRVLETLADTTDPAGPPPATDSDRP